MLFHISHVYILSFQSTLTLRLAGEWNYNPSQIGLVFLAQAVPGFASGPLTGHLSDKFGAKIVVLVCTMVTAVLCALLGLPNRSTGIAPLIVILVLEGFFCAGVQSPIMSEIAAVVELENKEDGDSDGFAKSYAVFNIALAGGMLVGPLLGGFVYSAIGYFWLNIILTCALAFCIPIIYFWIGAKGGLIQRPSAQPTAATNDVDGQTTDGAIEGLEKVTNDLRHQNRTMTGCYGP
jgi:MFS family permease